MNEQVIGKTIGTIQMGEKACVIKFTDGTDFEIEYFQSGYYGSEVKLEYFVNEPNPCIETTESPSDSGGRKRAYKSSFRR